MILGDHEHAPPGLNPRQALPHQGPQRLLRRGPGHAVLLGETPDRRQRLSWCDLAGKDLPAKEVRYLPERRDIAGMINDHQFTVRDLRKLP
jgi:hypothetical protein